MTDQRQQEVRRLSEGSFQGEFGMDDMHAFKRGIYDLADSLGILAVVALDADLEIYGLQRQAVLIEPAPPAAGAAAAVTKAYDIARARWDKQNTALGTLKRKAVNACDYMALVVIEEIDHGTIRRSMIQIITLLIAQYANMNRKELMTRKKAWEQRRWDAATDFLAFTASFMAEVAFLNRHGAGLVTDTEQVHAYQEAIAHVPQLAALASAAFYHAHPDEADQTMANCLTQYRKVYRTQYANTTAATHHASINQAKQSDNNLERLMTSVRHEVGPNKVSDAQRDAIIQAVRQAMKPHTPAAGDRTAKGARTGGRTFPAPKPVGPNETLLANGLCHRHAWSDTPHRWEHCKTNPDCVARK